jgi:hypothetical protein
MFSFIKNLFTKITNHKSLSIALIYAIIITSWSVYSYKQNQTFYNWIIPRYNYFNNFVKDSGYELSREKGFYCVMENRCFSSVGISSFNYYNRETNFQVDWVKAIEHLIPDYSQISSSSMIYDQTSLLISSIQNDQSKTFPRLYGFIGGDKVEVKLKQKQYNNNEIEGSYYSTSENKTYKLIGRINPNTDNMTGFTSGNVSMNEFENDSISGRMDINSDKPQGMNGGGGFGLSFDTLINEPAKIKKLFGNYTSVDGINYDLYLTQDENEIANWSSETFDGKLYNNSNSQSVFIKVGDKFYHSKITTKFKNFPNESDIIITGKTRQSYQNEYYADKNLNCYEGGCGGNPGYYSKDLLFSVTDVKLIEHSRSSISISS